MLWRQLWEEKGRWLRSEVGFERKHEVLGLEFGMGLGLGKGDGTVGW